MFNFVIVMLTVIMLSIVTLSIVKPIKLASAVESVKVSYTIISNTFLKIALCPTYFLMTLSLLWPYLQSSRFTLPR